MLRNEDVAAVKSSVNMKMLAQAYGIAVNYNGFALCPFHADKKPSMKVYEGYLTKDGYHCYACGAGGDIIKFTMDYEGVDFETAVKHIAGMFGVPIAEKGEITKEERRKIEERKRKMELERQEAIAERKAINNLSDRIKCILDKMDEMRPLSDAWCQLADKLPQLEDEWQERFAALKKH